MTIQNTTACIGARCADSFAAFNELNSMSIAKSTDSIVKATEVGATVNVAGTSLYYGHELPLWNITTDMAAAADMFDAAEQADRFYYLYLKKNGDTVISDIFPYCRRELFGWYHPYNVWRCVGVMYNDSSSNIQSASSVDSRSDFKSRFEANTGNGYGSTNTKQRRVTVLQSNTEGAIGWKDSSTEGAWFYIGWPAVWSIDAGEVYSNTCNTAGFVINSTNGAVDIQSGGGDFVYYLAIASADSNPRRLHMFQELFLGDNLSLRTGGLSNNTGTYVTMCLKRDR
jgi:hypothetical protein